MTGRPGVTDAQMNAARLDAANLIEAIARKDHPMVDYILDHGLPSGIAVLLAFHVAHCGDRDQVMGWLRSVPDGD